MQTGSDKPKLKESDDIKDLFRMQARVALVESMRQSKTLIAMVIVGLMLIGCFFLFLFNIAG